MSGDLSNEETSSLERLAYGRAESPEAERLAAEAAQELARRRTVVQAHPESAPPGLAPGVARDTSDPDAGNDEPDEQAERPWWRRPVVVIAAGILVIGTATVVPTIVDDAAGDPSSLDVFDREPSARELALLPTLRSAGQDPSLGPRVIGAIEYGTIVAYRSTLSNPGQEPRELVCVGVIETEPISQSERLEHWRCIEHDDFASTGFSATLYGFGGQYDVSWGPVGEAELDVLISEAQRVAMEPGFRSLFMRETDHDAEQELEMLALLHEQAGYLPTDIRILGHVPYTPQREEAILAFAGLESVETGTPIVCLAIVGPESIREESCTDPDSMATTALQLDIVRAERLITVRWYPTGSIAITETQAKP